MKAADIVCNYNLHHFAMTIQVPDQPMSQEFKHLGWMQPIYKQTSNVKLFEYKFAKICWHSQVNERRAHNMGHCKHTNYSDFTMLGWLAFGLKRSYLTLGHLINLPKCRGDQKSSLACAWELQSKRQSVKHANINRTHCWQVSDIYSLIPPISLDPVHSTQTLLFGNHLRYGTCKEDGPFCYCSLSKFCLIGLFDDRRSLIGI